MNILLTIYIYWVPSSVRVVSDALLFYWRIGAQLVNFLSESFLFNHSSQIFTIGIPSPRLQDGPKSDSPPSQAYLPGAGRPLPRSIKVISWEPYSS